MRYMLIAFYLERCWTKIPNTHNPGYLLANKLFMTVWVVVAMVHKAQSMVVDHEIAIDAHSLKCCSL